jgi:cyclic lactone autoinducer peptide
MKKLIRKLLVSGIATILLTIAATGITSACAVSFYQPESPKDSE